MDATMTDSQPDSTVFGEETEKFFELLRLAPNADQLWMLTLQFITNILVLLTTDVCIKQHYHYNLDVSFIHRLEWFISSEKYTWQVFRDVYFDSADCSLASQKQWHRQRFSPTGKLDSHTNHMLSSSSNPIAFVHVNADPPHGCSPIARFDFIRITIMESGPSSIYIDISKIAGNRLYVILTIRSGTPQTVNDGSSFTHCHAKVIEALRVCNMPHLEQLISRNLVNADVCSSRVESTTVPHLPTKIKQIFESLNSNFNDEDTLYDAYIDLPDIDFGPIPELESVGFKQLIAKRNRK